MTGDVSFWWYGLILNLVLGLAILIPVWRGRADALTAWNLLLLGSIIHIGFGCMEVYANGMHWPELKWFQPNTHEKKWMFVGTTVFYASLLFFHAKVRFPTHILQNRLTKWPDLSSGVVLFVLAICTLITVAQPLVKGVPFLSEVAINFAHCALATATTFTTVYWLKNRLSPFALLLMLVTLGVAVVESMVSFAGRRLLLTVLFGPVAAVYWLSWRYWSRATLISVFGVIAVGFLVVAAAFSTFRHTKQNEERTASTILNKAKSVSMADVEGQLSEIYHYLAQYTVHYSLLTMRLVDTDRLDVIPFDTLRLIAAYPIPRSLWPEKPRDECQFMSTEVLKMPYKTNWGVGIAGQGYHDGGLVVLIVYAFLASIMVRIFDAPLARQPDNPFLLAALASASAHIAAWSRGGISAMTLNVLETIVFILLLGYACRLLFGTSRNYAATARYAWPMTAYSSRQ